MDLKEAQLTDYKVTARHPWELARLEVVKDILKTYTPKLLESGTNILDMGCGDTWFIEQLFLDFPEIKAYGVDIAFSEEMLTQLNQKYKNGGIPIKVSRAMDEFKPEELEQIDLVLLLDVIEHIEDDISFLSQLRKERAITNNTVVLITVPAYQQLFCQHDVFLEHYRRYTNTSLIEHIEKAGYTPLHKGYFFSSLLVPRTIKVIQEKLTGPSTAKGIGDWQGSNLKTRLMKNILWTDYSVGKFSRKLGLNLPGLSNFMLCKPTV